MAAQHQVSSPCVFFKVRWDMGLRLGEGVGLRPTVCKTRMHWLERGWFCRYRLCGSFLSRTPYRAQLLVGAKSKNSLKTLAEKPGLCGCRSRGSFISRTPWGSYTITPQRGRGTANPSPGRECSWDYFGALWACQYICKNTTHKKDDVERGSIILLDHLTYVFLPDTPTQKLFWSETKLKKIPALKSTL